jgi:hypothetical protein
LYCVIDPAFINAIERLTGDRSGAKIREQIQQRIETLERGLKSSMFEPEKENIRAAIQGYKSGEIGYTENYTLIWAGTIVDTAVTYAEFTKDRHQRLDRYEKQHGAHWLWWESGLKIHPNDKPRMSKSVALPRAQCHNGLGQYWVKQVFWKRSGWVTRMKGQSVIASEVMPSGYEAFFRSDDKGRVWAQEPGAKLVFQSLLDSGASYPSLYKDDFLGLGIDPMFYAAQSIERFGTANGLMEARTYELYVAVVDDANSHLVDPQEPVWPRLGAYLGGLCPVVEVLSNTPEVTAEGWLKNERLSGILPFLACYLTSTPARNNIWLGEDRNDVLGLHRIPGQRRWDVSMSAEQPFEKATWAAFDNPKITFIHGDGTVIDQDRMFEKHNADWVFFAGQLNEIRMQSHPGRAAQEERAQAERNAQVQAEADIQAQAKSLIDAELNALNEQQEGELGQGKQQGEQGQEHQQEQHRQATPLVRDSDVFMGNTASQVSPN